MSLDAIRRQHPDESDAQLQMRMDYRARGKKHKQLKARIRKYLPWIGWGLLALCIGKSAIAQVPNVNIDRVGGTKVVFADGININCVSGCAGGSAADVTTSGSITGAAQSVSAAVSPGYNSVSVAVSGTWTIALTVEISVDGGTNWSGSNFTYPGGGKAGSSGNLVSDGQNGSYVVPLAAAVTNVRVRSTGYTSGTANITLRASSKPNLERFYEAYDQDFKPGTGIAVGGVYPSGDTFYWLRLTDADPNAGDIGVITRNIPSGVQHIECDSGCGGAASFGDDDPFTPGTTSVNVIGAEVDDTGTTNATENSAGAVRMSAARILYIDLSKTTANTTAIKVDGSAVTQPVSGTFWQATQPVSGTVTVTDGAGALNVVVDSITAGNNNIGDVDVATIAAGNNNIGDVDVASIAAGNNNIGDVDVASLPNVTIGTFPDNEPFNLNQVAGSAIATGNGTAAGSVRVSLANDSTGIVALTTSTASIGKLAANSGIDIGDVDVTSVVPGTAATNLGKAEDAGHTTGDVGVMQLAVRKDTNATLTNADGDYVQISADNYGVQYARADHPNRIACTADNIAATLTELTGCGVPGAGLSIYVTDIVSISTTATAGASQLRTGTGTNCGTGTAAFYPPVSTSRTYLSPANNSATGPFQVHFNTPMKIAANTALCVIGAATNTTNVLVTGFIAP